MAGELQARRRKVKDAKGAAGDDADEPGVEDRPPDGSTCLTTVVALVLLSGVALLGYLIFLQSLSGELPAMPAPPQFPSARPAEVRVEQTGPAEGPPPPPSPEQVDSAVPEPIFSPEDATTSAAADSGSAALSSPSAAPSAEPAAPEVAVPVSKTAGGAPSPAPAPAAAAGIEPLADSFRLEGSEPEVQQGEMAPQMVQQKVRVRQVIKQHTHADGRVTEEVVSEHILQPGEEGYDDVDKEPVTVSRETFTVPAGGG